MTLLENIEQKIYDSNIVILNIDDLQRKAGVTSFNGKTYIAKNDELITDNTDEAIALGHELYHYLNTGFYTVDMLYINRAKIEYDANSDLVEFVLPPDDIKKAIFKGCCISVGDIAEYVDMLYDFVDMALHIYQRQGELPYKHELPEEYFDMCADEC